MWPDEPDLNALSDSVARGDHVDWDVAETATSSARQRSLLAALRGVERIAEFHRSGPSAGRETGAATTRSHPWGHLIVLELARAGANGEVWRAWDGWLQREVALKFLQTSEKPSAEASKESSSKGSPLMEEARALARV